MPLPDKSRKDPGGSRDPNLSSSPVSSGAKRVAVSALFASLALIFSYIEAILPASPGIPGIKLGIANLVVIIAMYRLDPRYALSINLVRIFLAGFMFSGLYGALYSLCGCLLSFAVMYIMYRSGRFSIIGVSMGGGVAHNLGQLCIAAVLVSSIRIFYYLPVLILSGTVSGILIGWLGYVMTERLPKRIFM